MPSEGVANAVKVEATGGTRRGHGQIESVLMVADRIRRAVVRVAKKSKTRRVFPVAVTEMS